VDLASGLALAISALALLASSVAYVRQHRLQARMAAIEEARREEEVASRLKADVTAEFESETREGSRSKNYWLVLINRGPAVARDVDFTFIPPEKGEAPEPLDHDHSFPLSLDPEQRYRIICVVVMGTAASVQVKIDWKDDRGPQTKTLVLTIF
jgi:hypothetical protein